MKLSENTINVLKNFSTINQGIKFTKGNKLKTVSSSKTVMAVASIIEDIPQDFCIYDLNQFLSVNSLFKEKPELSFNEPNIIFKTGRSNIKYRMTAENQIVVAPAKDINLTSIDVKFTLNADDYDWLIKTSKVLSSPNIALISDGDKIELSTLDVSNDAVETSSIQIAEGDGKKFKIVFHTENFKMIPGSYEVSVTFGGVAHFKNTKDDIQYWIAFEAKHTKIGE